MGEPRGAAGRLHGPGVGRPYAGRVHALLVVNPAATSTSSRTRDVIVHALADELDLEVVQTDHRGHARRLGYEARRQGLDVVVALGGDGTVNELVDGMLTDGPGDDVPYLGAIPGGSANVFVRALGLPADPVEATGALLEAVGDKRTRTIGLGTVQAHGPDGAAAPPRWFTFNCGLGIDAEIVEAMEQQRAHGVTASPGRYLATTLRHYFRHTDRREPLLTLERPGLDPDEGLHFAFVQNTAPWTYLGPVRVDPCPRASFDTGLDLFAAHSMTVSASLRHARRMLTRSRAGSWASLLSLHDQNELVLRARRPVPLQVDGDSCGAVSLARLRAVRSALRVLA